MSAANITNLGAILKRVWPRDEVEDLFYEESPLLAMVTKEKDWSGIRQEIVVGYGSGGGRSSNFDDAKASKSASQKTSMSILTSDNFALWSVDHKLITLSRNDKGAVLRALQSETEAKMRKFKRSLCWMMYGNGGGSIGQVSLSATIASTTLLFRSTSSIRNLDIGDVLVFSTDNGDPTASQAGVLTGQVTITAIDEEAGSVTVDTALSTAVPSITTSSYVFIKGDYGNALYGLQAYVPSSAPTSSIWGMARTSNKLRLGGIRVGGKGLLIQEAVKKALTRASKAGASPDLILMNPDDFLELDLSLGTQKRYADEKVGSVGFSGIEFVNGSSKPIKCFSDADCPANSIWLLTKNTWVLHSAGDYPDFLNINGDRYMMEEASNSFEGRIGGYAQFYTTYAGKNVFLDRTAA